MIAVEQENDAGNQGQELTLGWGKAGSQQGNRGNPELMEAHDAPGALGDDDIWVVMRLRAMPIVEKLGFGKASWKTPFEALGKPDETEVSSGITKRSTDQIMESNRDGGFQETGPEESTGFEGPGGGLSNPFVGQQGVIMAERKGMGKRLEKR